MASETAAADIYVGRDYGRHDIVITPEVVAAYCDSIGHADEMYSGPSPFGGPVAPALVRHSEVYEYRNEHRTPAWYLPNLYGNLHARQEFEFFRPVMVGDAVNTRLFVADRYAKRGRDYVVAEVLYFDAAGAVVARGRTHQSFLPETTREGVVVDKSREKAPGRRFDIDVAGALEAIPPLTTQITDEMCFKFSGPDRNYHNDREAARNTGFPDIVVQGMMSICFLSEMMTRRFRAGWIAGGKLDVHLVNIVWGSDRITARGYIREITAEGARRRAHLDVWAEKDDGTKVTVGRASAVMSAVMT
jgi:acyl dehydratase